MVGQAIADPAGFCLVLLFFSLRTLALLALLPPAAGVLLPARVRLGIALWVGIGIAPTQPMPDFGESVFAMLLPAVQELLIGAAAGLVIQALFGIASVAGELIAQSAGLGFAAILDPARGSRTMIEPLLTMLVWSAFLASGGFAQLLGLIAASYAAVPAGHDAAWQWSTLSSLGGLLLAGGLTVAAPVVAVLVLVNLVVAVAARSAPQLSLFAIGLPLMLIIGMVLLWLLMPAIAEAIELQLGVMMRQLELMLAAR